MRVASAARRGRRRSSSTDGIWRSRSDLGVEATEIFQHIYRKNGEGQHGCVGAQHAEPQLARAYASHSHHVEALSSCGARRRSWGQAKHPPIAFTGGTSGYFAFRRLARQSFNPEEAEKGARLVTRREGTASINLPVAEIHNRSRLCQFLLCGGVRATLSRHFLPGFATGFAWCRAKPAFGPQ